MSGSHRTPARASLTGRGKIVAAVTTVTLAGVVTFGYFALFPGRAPAFVRSAMASVGIADPPPPSPPPPVCPLTGVEAPRRGVPQRSALAIKVENAPEARPQAALNDADVVVEEPVEGGYTRFIAIFHCGESDRVGPVRSGRTTDPDYLRQYGEALFGYAGGVPAVKAMVPRAGLIDVNYIIEADSYTRDASRSSPHNLYTTTRALWKAARGSTDVPAPVFEYSEAPEGKARRISGVHLGFSAVSDVYWTWSRRHDGWLRSHGQVAHMLEDGSQVSAANIVIQVVQVTDSAILDAAGNPSPDVELTGSGKAYVLRDGRLIRGRWERDTLDDLTRFLTKDGTEIALAPGRTWVELLPSHVEVESVR
ncbi:MAG: DUF3048 domain-containing protein [Actinomycetota bacterium]